MKIQSDKDSSFDPSTMSNVENGLGRMNSSRVTQLAEHQLGIFYRVLKGLWNVISFMFTFGLVSVFKKDYWQSWKIIVFPPGTEDDASKKTGQVFQQVVHDEGEQNLSPSTPLPKPAIPSPPPEPVIPSSPPEPAIPSQPPKPVIPFPRDPIVSPPPAWNEHVRSGLLHEIAGTTCNPSRMGLYDFAALLYQRLLVEDKRKDIAIVPTSFGELPEGLIPLSDDIRFVVVLKGLQNAVLLDKVEKNMYWYTFDSETISREFHGALMDKGLVDPYWQTTTVQNPSVRDPGNSGFHIVEMIVQRLTGLQPLDSPYQAETRGDVLQDKWKPVFQRFVETTE